MSPLLHEDGAKVYQSVNSSNVNRVVNHSQPNRISDLPCQTDLSSPDSFTNSPRFRTASGNQITVVKSEILKFDAQPPSLKPAESIPSSVPTLSLAQRRFGGNSDSKGNARMNAFKNKLNLGSEDRLENIRAKSEQILQQFEEAKDLQFDAKYVLGKELGQGMHAQVYLCYLKEDIDFKTPYAVKISRESDEEKKLAHRKEFDITANLNHKNIVKSIEFYDNELKGEIH